MVSAVLSATLVGTMALMEDRVTRKTLYIEEDKAEIERL